MNITRANINQAKLWITSSNQPLKDFRNHVQNLNSEPLWIPSVVEYLISSYQIGSVIFESDQTLKEELENAN